MKCYTCSDKTNWFCAFGVITCNISSAIQIWGIPKSGKKSLHWFKNKITGLYYVDHKMVNTMKCSWKSRKCLNKIEEQLIIFRSSFFFWMLEVFNICLNHFLSKALFIIRDQSLQNTVPFLRQLVKQVSWCFCKPWFFIIDYEKFLYSYNEHVLFPGILEDYT